MINDFNGFVKEVKKLYPDANTFTNSGEVQIKKISKDKDGKDVVDFEWVNDPKLQEIVARHSVLDISEPDVLAEIMVKLEDIDKRISAIERKPK